MESEAACCGLKITVELFFGGHSESLTHCHSVAIRRKNVQFEFANDSFVCSEHFRILGEDKKARRESQLFRRESEGHRRSLISSPLSQVATTIRQHHSALLRTMSFTTVAERSTMLQDVFIKNPSSLERTHVELDLGRETLDPIILISFCPFEWQSMLMAVATPTDIHIYKVPSLEIPLCIDEPYGQARRAWCGVACRMEPPRDQIA